MGVIGVIVLLLAVGFGIRYVALQSNTFFSPQERALENKVWKESEQYNDGMVRDLENLRMDYLKANDTQKDALKAVILHRFAGYNEDKLTPELRQFYRQLKGY
jgi:hypothetical protein